MKSLLRDNGSEIYSKDMEETSAVAERFITTLKNKIQKHVIAVSRNV